MGIVGTKTIVAVWSKACLKEKLSNVDSSKAL